MALKAILKLEHWHGHGEGGTLASIVIDGWQHDGYPWNSTPEDMRRAADAIEEINEALRAYGLDNGT